MTDWIERNRGHLLVVIINLAVIGAAFYWLQRPLSPQVEIVPASVPSPATPAPTVPLALRVYITGAVMRPDVYRLPPGSIVKDAVQAAGGTTAEADLARVNLALELRDQQRVHVPHVGEASTESAPGDADARMPLPPAMAQTRVNINTASAQDLEELPGIGPELAQRIVDWRATHGAFETIEDIKQVRGIGDAIFEQIKDRIAVGG
jgi:competence protein ComEA